MSIVRITDVSDPLSQLVERATTEREVIILATDQQAKAVLVGLDAFAALVGMREHAHRKLMPLENFQHEFRQALVEAGYDSREQIVDLVQEIKQQMWEERHPPSAQK